MSAPVASLLPSPQVFFPDVEEEWTAAEVDYRLQVPMAFATFSGVAETLAVYLLSTDDVVVAPKLLRNDVGRILAPHATGPVRIWRINHPSEQPAAYTRACLWALNYTATQIERETLS